MPKVLISDKLSPAAEQIFRDRGVDVDVKVGLKPDELKEIIGQYDGIAIRSATKLTADVLAKAEGLKVIGRAGIGVDNVDIPAATAAGIVVMNTPFGNSITTAEHAISMMMALARQIPAADRSTQDGKWEKSRFMGTEVTAKTLGIIGCGNIGAIVAERAVGLKMKVIAFDPFLSPERAMDLGVTKVELDELLRRADFITLHTPLTDGTRGILDARAFSLMKDGVYIINCARGGLVVEKDLADALDSGKVKGAALDVFEVEPARENVLFGRENVIATPHLGASTAEAQENVALQVAEQISDYLMDGAVANALNMPSITAEEAPRIRPYMRLAELLGSFAGQTTETGIEKITIEYEGTATGINTRPVTAVILQSLLAPLMDASVNMVNAPVVAKERDIEVSEIKHDRECDYHTQVTLTVTTERQSRVVSGTLFADNKPRIVNILGIDFEAELSPNMLYVINEDRPGFIGRLGQIFGDAGINIATFYLGRTPKTDDSNFALSLVAVDEPIPADILAQVKGLPNVIQAKFLRF